MPAQIFENVKGSELLDSLKEKLQTQPNSTYRIVVESEEEYAEDSSPPEEAITKETIDAVRESDKELKNSNFAKCKNESEIAIFFEGIKNDAL